MTAPEDVERQRIAHLVMGAPRPAPSLAGLTRPKDMPKAAWKVERRRLREAGVELAPGIEERVALREEWRGIEGTPETLEHAHQQNSRPGALMRLVSSGAIDAHQLAAAEQIQLAYQRTVADVSVRTANYERGTGGSHRKDPACEGIAAALLDRAYTRWRTGMGTHAAMLLSIIVDDVAVTVAARQHRLSTRRARAILIQALDSWRRG
jgi:hypothetical protein